MIRSGVGLVEQYVTVGGRHLYYGGRNSYEQYGIYLLEYIFMKNMNWSTHWWCNDSNQCHTTLVRC